MTIVHDTPHTNGDFPRDARRAADLYLSLGLAPIPLAPRTKDPGYSGWQNLRLTPENIDGYFPTDQSHNVGVLNGTPSSNTVDVDLDTQQARLAAPILLPPTGWVFGRKSSLQSHWIYRADSPLDTAQVPYEDVDGTMLVELRGNGGLTIYPPSAHKETGETVTWAKFTAPAEVPLSDLQQHVREVASAAILARHWPKKGNRDKAAMALTGALLRSGWTVEKVSRFVEAVATAAGDDEVRMRSGKAEATKQKLDDGEKVTGLPSLLKLVGEKVLAKVVVWLGLKVGSQQPDSTAAAPSTRRRYRPLPPYKLFPVEHLPEPLRSYVLHGAAALHCDHAYLALPALAVVASLIGNTRTIRLKRDWSEPSVVWAVVVADSGTLKSPALSLEMTHIYRLQKRLLDEFREKARGYEDEKAEYDKKKKAYTSAKHKEDADDPGTPPEGPVCPRLVCSDTTVEKLAMILEQNPRGVLLCRDELRGWIGSFTRYKGNGGGSDLPNWLEMFRAETIIVDRKTGDKTLQFVHRAAVSICGTIQPGTLARALTSEFCEAGLPARLCMAMPPKTVKVWSEDEIHPEVKRAYEDLLDTLRERLDFDTDDAGEQVPFAVRLSPEAKTIWVKFYNEWARHQAAAEGNLAAALAKLEAYAARFALLHHVVTHVPANNDCDPIEPESIEAGIALARWFAYEAGRIYAMLVESEEERGIRKLVEFIRARGGSITVRQLHRSNQGRYHHAEDAEQALDALVVSGIAKWETRGTTPKGGTPTKTCTLCDMTGDTTDTTPEDDDSPNCPDVTQPSDTTSGPPQADFGTDSNTATENKSGQGHTPGEHRGNDPTQVGSVGCVTCHSQENHFPVGGTGAQGLCHPPGVVSPSQPSHNCSATDDLGNADSCQVTGDRTDTTFTLITDPKDLPQVFVALDDADEVAMDLETTGLGPRTDRIRLVSLGVGNSDGGMSVYLVDAFSVGVRQLFERLADKTIIAHNATFDVGFLAAQGFEPGRVACTMLLSRLLHGLRRPKGFHGLKQCLARELGESISKEEQDSDWSGTLTREQLEYAAKDVVFLVPLYRRLLELLKATGQEQVVGIEARCLPAMVWLDQSGIAFDTDAWRRLAEEANTEALRLAEELDALAPKPEQGEMFTAGWNWSSPEQVKAVFALLGVTLDSTDDDALAGVNHPLAGLLRQYRGAAKRVTTYGMDWQKHIAGDGRIHAGWRQIGADSGRMACREPNLQNLPRDPRYRACFVAPAGRVLVKADYSQVELRIAAKVAGDRAMLDAYRRGEDLHKRTAKAVLGVEDVSKADRQLAKSLNFGLCFGMGAKRFREYAATNYGVELTLEQATDYRRAFFAAYPGLARWHQEAGRQAGRRGGPDTIETHTLAGRRRVLNRSKAKGEFPYSELLNSPVQGTGADGLKQALALLWERRADCPGAFPVLAVHDEIVIECDANQADVAASWLKQAMLDGMAPLIAPVPVEVDVTVSKTWGGGE